MVGTFARRARHLSALVGVGLRPKKVGRRGSAAQKDIKLVARSAVLDGRGLLIV
jgi:hypothetical protein